LTLQTAHDILHELCGMLGLQSEEGLEEFGLHADLGKRTSKLHPIGINVERSFSERCSYMTVTSVAYVMTSQGKPLTAASYHAIKMSL